VIKLNAEKIISTLLEIYAEKNNIEIEYEIYEREMKQNER